MKHYKKALFAGIPLAFLLLVSLAAGPCVEVRDLNNGLSSFRVTITDISGPSSGEGTAVNPYAYYTGDITLTFNAEAIDKRGQVMQDFNANVALRVTPGELSFPGSRVTLANGQVQGATVQVRKVFGRVNLWLEDIAWVQGENDHVGIYIFDNPEPDDYYDLHHAEGSWAAGTSNTIHFEIPTLAQLQFDPWIEQNDESSLAGNFVELMTRATETDQGCTDKPGDLVVTGIFNSGFYVTDLGDQSPYRHLYVYNYSYPDDLLVGDRLDRLAGSAADFSGCTQISFPAWTRAMDCSKNAETYRIEDLDAMVPPSLITTAMCLEESGVSDEHMCAHSKKNWTMEDLEGSRVRLENFRMPDVFIECDYNGDLQIPFTDVEGTLAKEVACRDNCLKRDGAVAITTKTAVATPAVLQAISENTCSVDTDCPATTSGLQKCGNWEGEEQDYTGICRTVCPWEETIEGIRPNCVDVRVGPELVCAELSTMRQYGQFVVSLDDGAGPLINIVTKESLVEFIPDAQQNLGVTIPFAQGNLQQVRAARPRWIVYIGKLPGDSPEVMKP